MNNDYYIEDKLGTKLMEKQKELLDLVSLNGLSNKQVLKCSQELDKLIYQIQTTMGEPKKAEIMFQ